MQWTRENFLLVDERRALDLNFIHGFLSETYWESNGNIAP
jgi:hypothetical protein